MACRLEWCDNQLHHAEDCTAGGGWHCVTCHDGFQNNMMAFNHREAHPHHQVGWSCAEHLVVESVNWEE